MKQRTRIYYSDAQKTVMGSDGSKAGRCTRSLSCSIARTPPSSDVLDADCAVGRPVLIPAPHAPGQQAEEQESTK